MFLVAVAFAEPTTELCTQEALETREAVRNASMAPHMLELMKHDHTLSEKTELVVEERTLKVGDRVRVEGRPGTNKSWATGHDGDVWIEGQTGVIRCFTSTQHGFDLHNELAVVVWDAQTWTDSVTKKPVQLPAYADVIHPVYLVVTPGTAP